ncbi:hypothetical protein CL1_0960 [Thermococcus cleftensis]|uniref:CARDB domain-containing protein n=2 Tax=Thermococcus cleftensis (strain DSM 27260 / KACC 17922 / CL1) TaxID=163003 RepID=I3ZTX9_THECF|nr:hypothetical protein CL1_0960 [Thermococcus cleftensis]
MVTAAGSTAQATSLETRNDPYEKFWEILNREAELVVQFNATGNTTLARELIQNSRLGAENAANISALIWQALEELKASGVKTYYTAEELREMAQNISRNGLPQETVEALKAQGWTDEQIQALEEYIVKNADGINEDFNMTAFLEEFSMAFIDVAFKYNEYETWTLEKWKWTNPQEINMNLGNLLINPVLADEWLDLYLGHSEGNYSKMKSAAEKLRDKMYDMIVGKTLNKETLTELKEHGDLWQLIELRRDVYVMWWLKNGGVVFRVYNSADNSSYGVYYWPNATAAYELASNIEALLTAKELGNNNPEVQWRLNDKIERLKSSLGVYPVKSGNSSDIVTVPQDSIENITLPIINPGEKYGGITDPVKKPAMDSSNILNSQSIEITPSESNSETFKEGSRILTALNPDTTRSLKINNVMVIPVEVSEDYATYKVSMDITVSGASATNVTVEIEGTELKYSKDIGAIDNGETITVESTVSGRVYGDYEVEVSGKIKVTYQFITEYHTNSESSLNPDDTPPTYSTLQAVEEYSSTIKLQYDPTKNIDVEVMTTPQSGDIKENDPVQFKIKVSNHNPFSITGSYYLKVEVPYIVSENIMESKFKEFTGSLSLQGFDDSTVYVGSITYPKQGTYKYEGYFKVGQYYKKFNGTIEVKPRPDGESPRIKITPLDWPSTARRGNTVSFKVQLDSTHHNDREARVELIIDNELPPVQTVETSVKAGSSTTVTLTWYVPSSIPLGEHKVTVRVWSRDSTTSNSEYIADAITLSNPDNPDDEKDHTINIGGLFNIKLLAYPTELEGGGEVYLQVKAWNYDGSLIPVKGFIEVDGDVIKNIEAKIPASANGDQILKLRYNFAGVGTHTIKVFLDNHDGEPNGEGEEYWSEVRVEVKGKMASSYLDCTREVYPGEKVTCVASWNPHITLQSLTLKEVWFGTKKVWDVDLSSVKMVKGPTLTPTSTIQVEIRLDDDFANYYFGERPWDPVDRVFSSYKDRLAGYTYKVKFIFENNVIAEDLVMVKDRGIIDEVKNFYNDIKDDIDAGKYVAATYIFLKGSGKLATKTAKRVGGLLSILLIGADIHDWLFGPNPDTGLDNNNVVGG